MVSISKKSQGEKYLALRWKTSPVVESISIPPQTSHPSHLPMSPSCCAHPPTAGESIELGKTAILWASKVVEVLINAVRVTSTHFPRVFVICTLRHSDSHLALAFCHVVMECISIAFSTVSLPFHALNQTLAVVVFVRGPPQSRDPPENPAREGQGVGAVPFSQFEEQLIWFLLLFEREPDHLRCKSNHFLSLLPSFFIAFGCFTWIISSRAIWKKAAKDFK